MKTILFKFDNNGAANERSLRDITRLFTRAGQQVVATDVAKTTTKRAGISFRNVQFTMADGQTVILAVKESGDVFEVKINGKVQPLRQQDDHTKAIGEIAGYLDRKRSAFQRALARTKVPLPPSIRTSRKAMVTAKVERRDALREAVSEAKTELSTLTGQTA